MYCFLITIFLLAISAFFRFFFLCTPHLLDHELSFLSLSPSRETRGTRKWPTAWREGAALVDASTSRKKVKSLTKLILSGGGKKDSVLRFLFAFRPVKLVQKYHQAQLNALVNSFEENRKKQPGYAIDACFLLPTPLPKKKLKLCPTSLLKELESS